MGPFQGMSDSANAAEALMKENIISFYLKKLLVIENESCVLTHLR